MIESRKQLTLFVDELNGNIEKIRSEFNSAQYGLIAAHVTLCREDEIEELEIVKAHLRSIRLPGPLQMELESVERFAEGNGVLMRGSDKNDSFQELRKLVLGQRELKKEQSPHITLMHPRNSVCTDEIFDQIQTRALPLKLEFRKISLIEQKSGARWEILETFDIVNEALESGV